MSHPIGSVTAQPAARLPRLPRAALVAVVAWFAVTVAAGAMPVSADAPPGSDRASYRLEAAYDVAVDLDWDTRMVDVDTRIALRNTSGGPVGRLELSSIAGPLGGLRVRRASLDGQAAATAVRGQTIVVTLPSPIAEGAEAKLRIAVRARLRTTTAGRDHLWTISGGVARLYRFIPWLSRRIPFGPTMNGEPFLTPAATSVRVALRADRRVVWATTGRRVGREDGADIVTVADARDLNVTASPGYRVTSGRSRDGATRILVYTRREDAALWLRLARRELARFEARFGPYPWPTYRLAEVDSGIAMESPGLVWLPRGRSASNYAYLVAHETAHQWFYAIVGNDQSTSAFADEAVADFLARDALGTLRGSRCPRDRLDRSIHDYAPACYYETIYIQGGRFLDDLRRDFGAAGFWRGLRRYARDHRFGIGSDRELLEALRAELGDGVLPRYRARFPSLYPRAGAADR